MVAAPILSTLDLTAQLAQRGIDRAAAANGWQEGHYDGLPGWLHPVYSADGRELVGKKGRNARGFKNADRSKSSGKHDAWPNYPQQGKPLFLPKAAIKDAIACSDGILHMAEGKADTLSLWAAGIPNAAGIFGSSLIPDDLATQLTALDVRYLAYYAHDDQGDSGFKAAYKIAHLLQGSGIAVYLYRLPRTADGRKVDLNDLWIETAFDPDAFTERLGTLDPLPPQLVALPKAAPKPSSSAQLPAFDSENAKEQIKRQLSCYDYMRDWLGEPKQRSADGGHWPAPNREERTASFFAYHGDRGFFDFGADTSGDVFMLDMIRHGGDFVDALQRLADRCGVKMPERSTYTRPMLAIVPKSDPSVASGLPVRLRARLNSLCHPAVAPLLELHAESVQRGLVEPEQPLTRSDLLELAAQTGRNVSENTIRVATDQGAGQFLLVLPVYSDQEKESDPPSSKTHRNTTPGRKSPRYVFLALDQIKAEVRRQGAARLFDEHFPADNSLVAPLRQEIFTSQGMASDTAEQITQLLKARYGEQIAAQPGFAARTKAFLDAVAALDNDLADPTTAPIPAGWQYENTWRYTRCCARAILEAEGGQGQHGKVQWAGLLGKSQRTVREVLRGAGLDDKNAYRPEKVVTSAAELPATPSQWHKLIVCADTPEPVAVFHHLEDREAADRFIAKHQKAGHVVKFATQVANQQKVSSTAQPPVQPRHKQEAVEPKQKSEPKLTPVRRPYFGRGLAPDNWRDYPLKLARLAIGRADPDTGELIETAQLALDVLLRNDASAAIIEQAKTAYPLPTIQDTPLTAGDTPAQGVGVIDTPHDVILNDAASDVSVCVESTPCSESADVVASTPELIEINGKLVERIYGDQAYFDDLERQRRAANPEVTRMIAAAPSEFWRLKGKMRDRGWPVRERTKHDKYPARKKVSK